MIEEGAADAFVNDWIAAWNARDLDAVLSHYADDIEFWSPLIAKVTGKPVPCVRGKLALESYWSRALDDAPEINFSLERVYIGAQSLTIAYTNHRGQHAAETLVFDDHGRVKFAVACYR